MPKSNIFIRKRYLNLKSYKSASESLLIIVFIYDRNNINVFTIIDCHSCALQRLVLFNKCMHAPCCLLSPQALFKIDDKNLTFPAAFPKLTIPSFWPDIIVTRLYTFHFFWSQFVCRVQNNVCLSHRHHSIVIANIPRAKETRHSANERSAIYRFRWRSEVMFTFYTW